MVRHVAPLEHIILIPSQPIFDLTPYISCAWLVEKQQTPIIYTWFDSTGACTHDLLHDDSTGAPTHDLLHDDSTGACTHDLLHDT